MAPLSHQQIIENRQRSLVRPDLPEPQQFIAPSVDVGRLSQLRQRAAAPEVRRLRQGLTRSIQGAQRRANPAVARSLTRASLSGYGEGLENVLRGAGQVAQGQYQPEFAAEVGGRELEFQAGESRTLAEYQADLEDYLRSEALRRQEEVSRRPRRRSSTFREVQMTPLSGRGGLGSTSEAISYFTGARTGGAPQARPRRSTADYTRDMTLNRDAILGGTYSAPSAPGRIELGEGDRPLLTNI